MQQYNFGDYVVFDDGYRPPELGRITRDESKDFVHVCYHEGCTAAATNREQLRLATQEEIDANNVHFGHHRFDDYCPDYDRDACFMCIHAGYRD